MRLRNITPLFLLPFFATPLFAQTHAWVESAGGNWTTPANWSPASIPNGAADYPRIDLAGSYTVTVDLDVLMDRFDFLVSGSTLSLSNRTMTMNNAGSFGPTTTTAVVMVNSAWLGNGALTNNASIEARGISRFSNILQNGVLDVVGHNAVGNGTVTLDQSTTNNGTIGLDSIGGGFSATLSMATGMQLQNFGELELRPGAGGARTFIGGLSNSNNVTISTPSTLSTGPIDNLGGNFLIQAPHLLTLSTGVDVNLSGGLLQIDGDLKLNGGDFNFSGGSIIGYPRLFGGSLDLSSPNQAQFKLFGGVALSGDISAAQELQLLGSSAIGNMALTSPNPFTNFGLLRLLSEGGGFGSTLIMGAGSALTNSSQMNIEAGAGGARTFNGELINDGVLQISANTNFNIGPFRNRGSWTIDPGASLTLQNGSDFTLESGTLDLQGTFLHHNGSNQFDGGSFTAVPEFRGGSLSFSPLFSSTFTPLVTGGATLESDLPAATTMRLAGSGVIGNAVLTTTLDRMLLGTLDLDSIGGGFAATWAGIGTTLTNQGILRTLAGAGGARSFNGALDNHGTVDLQANTTFAGGALTTDGSWSVAPSTTMIISNGQDFSLLAGTLDIAGALTHNGNGAVNFLGGSMTGVPLLRGVQLSFDPLQFTAPAEATLIGSNTLLTDVPAATTLHLDGSSQIGNQVTTVPADTTLFGTTKMGSSGGGFASTLTATAGATITQAGSLFMESSAGGARTISGLFHNTGSMAIQAATTFPSGTLSNEGTLTTDPGTSLTLNSPATFVQQSGTFDNQGSFLHTGGSNLFVGGAISGQLQLRSSSLTFDPAFTQAVDLALTGATNFFGATASGQQLHLLGSSVIGNQVFTAAAGLQNGGRLLLSSEGGGFGSTLTVSGGPIANSGAIRAEIGVGGARTITGQLDNSGFVSVIGTSATFNGGSFTNLTGGTVRGDGTYNLANATLQNDGTIEPGDGIGSLALTGNLAQGPDGILAIQIGGLIAGSEHDVLNVSANATLDGEVHLRLANGYIPSFGDQFTILNAASISGEFTAVRIRGGQLALGLGFELVTSGTTVVAQVVRAIVPPPGGTQLVPVVVSAPVPGIANQNNTFQVSGLSRSGLVELVFGLALGSTPIPGCPDDYGIQSATVLGTALTSNQGNALVTGLVPPAAAGATVYFQALDLASCRLSEVNSFLFP